MEESIENFVSELTRSLSFLGSALTNILCHVCSYDYLDKLKGAVSRQSSSFFLNFTNYSPSIAVERKVSKEITCK